ncbi:hypothetical protein GCM10027161_00860 [Microbispora hainanensis]
MRAVLDIGRGDVAGLGASARCATTSVNAPQPDRLTTRATISDVLRTGGTPKIDQKCQHIGHRSAGEPRPRGLPDASGT